MIVSYERLSRWFQSGALPSPERVAEILTMRGLEVEAMEVQAAKLAGVVVAKILDKGKHPNSDRLSLCKVDDGTHVRNVVCGAQNHKTGDHVALATVGTTLPNGLTIKLSKIRDIESEGMLCSEQELGLSKESEGIMILSSGFAPGTAISRVLQKTDTLFTLKLYANQSYALSYLGVARELSSHLGCKLKDISDVLNEIVHDFSVQPHLTIAPKCAADVDFPGFLTVWDEMHAPAFYGAVLKGVKVGPSPEWLIRDLERTGSRSINNIVDLTNWILQELGQPTHAYDLATLNRGIGVALDSTGKKLVLLDDSSVTLTSPTLVIVDGESNPIGLAGVMGGDRTKVTENTTDVFLEVASFSPRAVRATKKAHKKNSDAAVCFERGVDGSQIVRVLEVLSSLINKLSGSRTVSCVGRTHGTEVTVPWRKEIVFKSEWLSTFLGLKLTSDIVTKLLVSLGCKVALKDETFYVTPPGFRPDLNLREDIAEEVARTLGYDQIPSTLPVLQSPPQKGLRDSGGQDIYEQFKFKNICAGAGYSEAIHFGFSDPKLLLRFGIEGQVKVVNPLSEEHSVMSPSLVPQLVQSAAQYLQKSFGSEFPTVKLFELRPVFKVGGDAREVKATTNYDTTVSEELKIGFVWAGSLAQSGLKAAVVPQVDFFEMKASLEQIFKRAGTKGVRFVGSRETPSFYHPYQVADVMAGGAKLGCFGTLHPDLVEFFKIRVPVVVGEFDWRVLRSLSQLGVPPKLYKPWTEQPGISRDYTFLLPKDLGVERALATIASAVRPLGVNHQVWDVYEGSGVPEGMNSTTFRVFYQANDRSLSEVEIEPLSQKLIDTMRSKLKVELKV